MPLHPCLLFRILFLQQKKRAERKLCLDALPQVKHDHDVSPEEKVCSECQREKTCIGEEISRVLEFVPRQLEVHNYHLKTFALDGVRFHDQSRSRWAHVDALWLDRLSAGRCV